MKPKFIRPSPPLDKLFHCCCLKISSLLKIESCLLYAKNNNSFSLFIYAQHPFIMDDK